MPATPGAGAGGAAGRDHELRNQQDRSHADPRATAIERISLAVMVDGTDTAGADGSMRQPRPAEEARPHPTLVKSAIGFDEKRGEPCELAIRFAPEEMAPAADHPDGLRAGRHPHDERDARAGRRPALLLVVRPMVMRLNTPPGSDASLSLRAAGAGCARALPARPCCRPSRRHGWPRSSSRRGEDESMINIGQIEGRSVAASMHKKIGRDRREASGGDGRHRARLDGCRKMATARNPPGYPHPHRRAEGRDPDAGAGRGALRPAVRADGRRGDQGHLRRHGPSRHGPRRTSSSGSSSNSPSSIGAPASSSAATRAPSVCCTRCCRASASRRSWRRSAAPPAAPCGTSSATSTRRCSPTTSRTNTRRPSPSSCPRSSRTTPRRVLTLLPESFAMEVVMRMLRMESVQKEVLDDVERTLRNEFLSNLARTTRRDAHELIAEIFNSLDRTVRDALPDRASRSATATRPSASRR